MGGGGGAKGREEGLCASLTPVDTSPSEDVVEIEDGGTAPGSASGSEEAIAEAGGPASGAGSWSVVVSALERIVEEKRVGLGDLSGDGGDDRGTVGVVF